jgi:hypothetical protein
MLFTLLLMPWFAGKTDANLFRDWLAQVRGAKGGKNSGAIRKAEKAAKWRTEGLLIAKDYVAVNPDYSPDDLADEIKFRLDDAAPKHGQIKNVIREWQRDSEIPRPSKKTGEPPSHGR